MARQQDGVPVLEVHGLGVTYGALQALRDVSWSVAAGEILGIIGPNGAGKSTAMAATTNSVRHAGRVVLEGSDVSALVTSALSRRGLRRTFQQNAFFSELTVLENASCALLWDAGSSLPEATFLPWRERRTTARRLGLAAELLRKFGIRDEYFGALPSEIPYGTQRILSLALSYGSGARALLLDEPAAGVGGTDMLAVTQKLRMLREEGIALVVIEHHMDLIMTVADRILVLNGGTMLASGTPQQIRSNDAVLEAYLGRT